jgi:hypothetical protein
MRSFLFLPSPPSAVLSSSLHSSSTAEPLSSSQKPQRRSVGVEGREQSVIVSSLFAPFMHELTNTFPPLDPQTRSCSNFPSREEGRGSCKQSQSEETAFFASLHVYDSTFCIAHRLVSVARWEGRRARTRTNLHCSSRPMICSPPPPFLLLPTVGWRLRLTAS